MGVGQEVAVPVRGAGCIYKYFAILIKLSMVAVPVRGAGCIKKFLSTKEGGNPLLSP